MEINGLKDEYRPNRNGFCDFCMFGLIFSLKSFGCLSKFYYFCIRFPLKKGYERCLDEFFEM